MLASTWMDRFRKMLPSEQKEKEEEEEEKQVEVELSSDDDVLLGTKNQTTPMSASATSKHKAWMDIVAKSKRNATYKQYTQYMSYDAEADRLICKCGGAVWQKTRHKPSDITAHFGQSKHKNWLSSIANVPKINKQRMKNKSVCSRVGDIVKEPLNFCYFRATFYCLYFIVHHNLSLTLLASFNALMAFLKIQCTGVSYIWAYGEMVTSFYQVRMDEIKHTMRLSNWYGIEFDESTSKTSPTSYLAITVSYRDRIKHSNERKHIRLAPLQSGKADSISAELQDFVTKQCELDDYKFVSCSGDNCSTNMGSKSGVMTRLSAIFSWIIIIGCYTHKLALLITACLSSLEYYVATELVVRKIITWARKGPKRVRAIQAAAKKARTKAFRINIIHKIRWLSKEAVIKSIYLTMVPLLEVLHAENEKEEADAVFLYGVLSNVYFWLYLALLLDVLTVIGMLSRYLQSDWVYAGNSKHTIAQSRILLHSKLSSAENPGHYVADFMDKVKKGKLKKYDMSADQLDTNAMHWVDHRMKEMWPLLKKEYEYRFPSNSQTVIDAFYIFNIYRIKKIIDNDDAFIDFGKEEIKIIAKAFHRQQRKIEVLQALNEWDAVKLNMKSSILTKPDITNEEFWGPMMIDYDDNDTQCAHYLILLMYDGSLRLKVNSADNERSFKTMNDTKTSQRNRMSDTMLDMLVFLKKSGWQCWDQIPIKKVVQYFLDHHDTKNDGRGRTATFNQNITFKHAQKRQYDELQRLTELAKTAKRKPKTASASDNEPESDIDLSGSDSDWDDNHPLLLRPDAVPDIFGALLPKNGAVTQTQCDGSEFLCDHEWTDVSSAVLRCSACQDVCCLTCLKKVFKVKQRDINTYLKKKAAFVCMQCTVAEIQDRKNEKQNKRKRRKRRSM